MVLLSAENAYNVKVKGEGRRVPLFQASGGGGRWFTGRAPYCGKERRVQPLPLRGWDFYRKCDTAERDIKNETEK